MTEDEWLVSLDPAAMLAVLCGRISDRKERLFAVAACKRIWSRIESAHSHVVVHVAERFADGLSSLQDLERAHNEADPQSGMVRDSPGAWAAWNAASVHNIKLTVAFARYWANAAAEDQKAESIAHSALLRDMFGNPFRPLPPRPEGIAPLAEQIYAGQWKLMPLLGEWLQEHGYWNEGEHCLDPQIHHVKGCWIVDWVTGRE
jgi:hypothetical protein